MNLLDSILDAGNITAAATVETKMRLNASYPGFRILLRTKSLGHRSVQSQLQIKNFQAIWHMPSYSLISWVPKTGKNKKIQRWSFFLDRSKDFPL